MNDLDSDNNKTAATISCMDFAIRNHSVGTFGEV
jgi:hypothetical protein